MIIISELERIAIQTQAPSPTNRLVMTGKGKKGSSRTYYVLETDKVSLDILARLRNTSIKSLLES